MLSHIQQINKNGIKDDRERFIAWPDIQIIKRRRPPLLVQSEESGCGSKQTLHLVLKNGEEIEILETEAVVSNHDKKAYEDLLISLFEHGRMHHHIKYEEEWGSQREAQPWFVDKEWSQLCREKIMEPQTNLEKKFFRSRRGKIALCFIASIITVLFIMGLYYYPGPDWNTNPVDHPSKYLQDQSRSGRRVGIVTGLARMYRSFH